MTRVRRRRIICSCCCCCCCCNRQPGTAPATHARHDCYRSPTLQRSPGPCLRALGADDCTRERGGRRGQRTQRSDEHKARQAGQTDRRSFGHRVTDAVLSYSCGVVFDQRTAAVVTSLVAVIAGSLYQKVSFAFELS